MSIPPIKYPLDLTGKSPANLVAGELHSLKAVGNRAFVPEHGPFFAESLVVRRRDTNAILEPGVDFVAAELLPNETIRTGREICAIVVIRDQTLGQNFAIEYQTLGGDQSTSASAIERVLETLNLDERAVKWGAILNKPEQFKPAPHLHDIGDTYGWEYIVSMLEAIRQAILLGDEAAHDELRQLMLHYYTTNHDAIEEVDARLTGHLNNTSNPHNTTKAQVGLGSVENYPIATKAQAEAGSSNVQYMTPLRVREAIMLLAGEALTGHLTDYSNPHRVTKAQVGLDQVSNWPIATAAQAQDGSGEAYMTPQRTAQAVTAQVGTRLNNHIADQNNPHGTTKAQVGLGLVNNWGIASTAEANAGTRGDVYMTPLLVANAINSQIRSPFNDHVNSRSNPHGVTATQVGLGSVHNFGLASTAEAQAGARFDAYMSPLLVKQAIDAQVRNDHVGHVNNRSNPHGVTAAQVGLGNLSNHKQVIAGSNNLTLTWSGGAIQATVDATHMGHIHTTSQPDPNLTNHRNDRGNPHGVSKAQVGLGQVQDLPLATTAQAQAGNDHNAYMTPLRVREAIAAQAASNTQGIYQSWGYWRDPRTGYTRCWGRTPRLSNGQTYYVYFRVRFTELFTVSASGICSTGDGNQTNPLQITEMSARIISHSLSTHGMAIVGDRVNGTHADYIECTYMAEGLSNGDGNGGVAGQYVAAGSREQHGGIYGAGGWTGHTGSFPSAGGGVGVGVGGVGGVGGGGVGGGGVFGSDTPIQVIQ